MKTLPAICYFVLAIAPCLAQSAANPFGTASAKKADETDPSLEIPDAELVAEIRPAAMKHKTASAALLELKKEAVSRLKKDYESTLASYEKSAISRGALAVAAAIVSEREVIAKGDEFPPTEPPEFPKNLLKQRKTFVEALDKTDTDFADRQERLDTEYLRVLSSLESKATFDAELARQLKSEKAAVLLGGALLTSQQLTNSLKDSTWEGRGKTMMLKRTFNSDGSSRTHWDNKKGSWKVLSGTTFVEVTGNKENNNWKISGDLQTIMMNGSGPWRRVK